MRVSDSTAVRNSFRRSIYEGQSRIGDVQQQDGEFVARDRRGKVLGRYDTMIEAANAISEAAAS